MSAAAVILGSAGAGVATVGTALVVMRRSQPRVPHESYGWWAAGNFLGFVSNVLQGSTGWATFEGALAVICAWMWWRGRRKGRMKKAVKELGAKSRARVQALVEKLTPSPIPSPVGAR